MGAARNHAGFAASGLLCVASAAWALSSTSHAASVDASGAARILYFEAFETTIDPRPALAHKPANTRLLKFDAHGKRFELALEPNERLQSIRTSTSGAALNFYRGKLTGIATSWARFATRGSEVHGLIWDGSELYVIEPGEAVRDSVVPPLDVSTIPTVLFRLSDTLIDTGMTSCAVTSSNSTGAAAFDSLRREFKAVDRNAIRMQAMAGTQRLELSAVGDASFRARYATDEEAIDAMLLRLNYVDGIFDEQLDVEIQVPTAVVFDAQSDPLTGTTKANDLLKELGELRQSSPNLRARGLTHLFTGRDLDGMTAGIGYVGSLCDPKFGAALTEINGRQPWIEALIAAHEIGHNFGAVHDGEDECAAIPQNQFLMSPTVNASGDEFSSCSRDMILQQMAGASCVTSLPPPDLSIPPSLGTVTQVPAQAFEWQLIVSNIGGRAAQFARADLLVPPSIEIVDAWVAGGTCTSGAGAISCAFDDIAGGGSSRVHLTLKGSTLGSHSITASITALADAQAANNSSAGTIVIEAAAAIPPAVIAPPAAQTGNPNSGSKGGGGSFDLMLLLALGSLRILRLKRHA